ncbi:hypothetical protein EHI8A_082000 [Entamoeba histolytica HM-1:IMSS-B]|uniref:Uncharacterized protein n=6 Tax=Entamoeba histolytica TaxID=5759 RepID=C4M9M4_ENTH1|nr:hypothetical protein EHI_112850 [Entamoeba histolytica HM-1:IMSS]EMD48174.1 Hypothetical protein EHI5A_121530 [Entamoeba histolytica KU27]EMH75627.1 hypothetical protein EHI8A_082000 [Entamoeba histolytica HM-1:IMSS-B]EMS12912.1 hypothetical protein KM1_142450 [Entamoeba histolytica HM-3:IMSS]ENY61134.1 hypothetical protein EHI7A_079770 [Entamoeba histolytica HM-1:IMSS-A]GAT98383.1 hypothetical protein CL6EHI_112850 [Entamoeba histolytica]|eukprot:XP_656102.1 hypothetical protein EHI_112850 [Entamoeba histolytica HM-1:IMSS]
MTPFIGEEVANLIRYCDDIQSLALVSKKYKEKIELHKEENYYNKEVFEDENLEVPPTTKVVRIKFGSGWYVRAFTTLAIGIKDLKLEKLIIELHTPLLVFFDKLLQFIPENTPIILEVHGLDEVIVEKYVINPQIKIGGFNSKINESLIQKKAFVLPERITTPSGVTRTYLSFEASVFDFYSAQLWKLYFPMNLKLKASGEHDKILKMKSFIFNSILITGKLKTIDLHAKNISIIRSYVPVDSCEELEVEQPFGFPEYVAKNKLKKLYIQYSKNITTIDLKAAESMNIVDIVCCDNLKEIKAENVLLMKVIDSPLQNIHLKTVQQLTLFGVNNVSVEGSIDDIQSDGKCFVNGTLSQTIKPIQSIDRKSVMIKFLPIYVVVLLIILGGIKLILEVH